MLKRMEVALRLVTLLLLAGCSSPWSVPVTQTAIPTLPLAKTTPGTAGIPNFAHVFVILMENEEMSGVIGSSAAPYINSLAQRYGRAANYFSMVHPSLPNYLELIGGSTYGVSSDCTDCFVNAPNLVDQLERAHKTWKAYMESMPSPCYVGDAGNYAQKHNPFLYFDDIRNNPARCANVVPLTGFSKDMQANALPDFVWVTPNLCNDMHDCGVGAGDAWLKSFLPQVLSSSAMQNSALFLLWDEGDSDAGCCQIASGGHIPALVISPLGKRGHVSQVNYTHASFLRTVEDAWGLGRLGDAACGCTNALTDFF